jgi:cytochrome c oxidase cbb3-type subunit 1
MVFSLILLAPSWGGMLNGLLTLSGAWHKLRDDPVIRFLIVSLSFYAMATFEGPMMSIKTVNALSHYTDWTIGHVHSGALGWVAMITIGSLYAMTPWQVGTKQMYSGKLIHIHFWLTTVGIVFYIVSIWIAGIQEGLMQRATNEDGTLTYDWVQILKTIFPYYVGRTIGGAIFLSGMFLMAYNIFKTLKDPKPLPDALPDTSNTAKAAA